jgi:Tfp pilus assembly protein PilN
MNAVNLIPRDGRTQKVKLPVSPPTLALIGGLVVVLIATVLYVTAANTVATRKSELAQVTAQVAGWTGAGNSYQSFVSAAKHRTQELADVRQLASARFPWADLLGQIGARLPKRAAVSTLAGATTSAADTSSASSASSPGVQLTGCAASQSAVAQTMVQLRRVNGVSDVTLASTSDSDAGSAGSSSSGQGSAGCPFPVQFQLSLTITPSVAAGTTNPGGGSTTPAPASATSTAATAQ